MPFCPCSDAGSKTVATTRSIAPAFCARSSSNARHTAAGCATTHGPGCSSGGKLARARAPPRASAPWLRVHPPAHRKDRRWRCRRRAHVSSSGGCIPASEAKKVKSTLLELFGAHALNEGDLVPIASSWPSDSSSSSRRISTAGKLRSFSISATSLPFSVPAPTMAAR